MGASAIDSGFPARVRSPTPPERHPGYPLRVFYLYDVLMRSCASTTAAAARARHHAPWPHLARTRYARALHACATSQCALVPTKHTLATISMGRLQPRCSAASYRRDVATTHTPTCITRAQRTCAPTRRRSSHICRLRLLSHPSTWAASSGAVVPLSSPPLFTPRRLLRLSTSHPPTAYHRGTGVSRLCLFAFPPSLLCASST